MGNLYLRFKDGLSAQIKKEMMIDDLWILLKKPIASSLRIEELKDILLVKSLWHYNQK
jgi:hypothetical protein